MDDQQKQTSNINTAVAATVSSAAAVISTQKPTIDRGKNLDKSFAEQQQAQINNNTKKLVDALVSLKKPFVDLAKQRPAKPGEGKGTTGIGGAIGGTIKSIIQDKLSPLKNLRSKEGILQTLATMSGGGLIGSIASGALEKRQAEKEEQKRKEEFKSAYLSSTTAGKKLTKTMGQEAASAEAEKLYNEKVKLEKEIADLKNKQKQIQETGVVGADLSKEEQKQLAAKEKRLGIVMGGPSRKSKGAKEESGTAAKVSRVPDSGAALQPGTTPESFEHLVEVNEDQLDSLKKIVKAVTETQEDKLEKRKSAAKEITEEKKEPVKKQEEKGLLGSLLEKLPIGDLLSKFGGGALATGAKAVGGTLAAGAKAMAPVAAKAALPLAAVGAAGYAGYKAGGLLSDYVLNPAAAAITGNKDETLGGALYSGVDKVKGMLGFQSDSKKMELAEQKSVEELYNKQMKEKGHVSPHLAKEMEKYGVKTPETLIKAPAPQKPETETDKKPIAALEEKVKGELAKPLPEGQPVSNTIQPVPETIAAPASRLEGADAIRANMRSIVGSMEIQPLPRNVSPVQPRAIEQTETMMERTAAVEEGKQQKPIVVTMPTPSSGPAVINNSTNTTIVRPETRTPEPTFNKILSKNFTFA